MKQGTCKMCLANRDLVSSHLIPAALYGYCSDEHIEPIRVSDGAVVPTSRQTQDYLLCIDCEGILNRGGESWVNSKLCRMDRKFPLYEIVVSGQPAFAEDENNSIYLASHNPAIDVEKLTHFGIGIFWKASVHSWKPGTTDPLIDLGPYSGQLRGWLRGQMDFPANVGLWVTVSPPERAQVTLNPPMLSKRTEYRTYLLHLLGLIYQLNVGTGIDPMALETCFYRNPEHPIVISHDLTAVLERGLVRQFSKARKTDSYLRAKKKREVALGRANDSSR